MRIMVTNSTWRRMDKEPAHITQVYKPYPTQSAQIASPQTVTLIDVGELEVDYGADIWADHDERCHGRIDSPQNKVENPEGFNYRCCGEDGESAGCEIDKHVEKKSPSKKRRY